MSENLTVGVLREVSRSFYLTIRALPPAMREPVGLAYLLARASDTMADAALSPVEARLEALMRLREVIDGRRKREELLPDLDVPHPGERLLLRRLPECLTRYEALGEGDARAVRAVLERIVGGQLLDVERFPDATEVRALPDANALEEYTYLVAGCVGAFWTELGLRHAANYTRETPAEMERLGVDFGKGLQLVNVLRDLPADLENGRCYLPENELAEAGVAPAELQAAPGKAVAVVNRWLGRATTLLGHGGDYVERVRPWRLRFAVFLPWYLGVRTLELLRKSPPLETRERVKVSRAEVRRAIWMGLLCAVSDARMRKTRRNWIPRS